MGQVNATIAGRQYRLACEDGQEDHLLALAKDIDTRIIDLRRKFGEIGDTRLTVMAALMLADEMTETRQKFRVLEEEIAALREAREVSADRARAASDAVAAGMGTVRLENPRLDARGVRAARQPRRLAFGTGPLPEGSELELRSGGLEDELHALAADGVQSLLLEGGPTLARAFLEAGLVDKLLLFVAPTLAGDGPLAVPGLAGPLRLSHLTSRQVGEDVLLEAYLREP